MFLKEKKIRKARIDKKISNLKETYKKIDHEAIRINFFGEPGIILNIFIISLINDDSLLCYYFIIISAYSSLRFLKSVMATYISFKNMNNLS